MSRKTGAALSAVGVLALAAAIVTMTATTARPKTSASNPYTAPPARDAVGMPGMDMAAAGMPSAASRLVPPSSFARAVADPRTVTINVHVPDEGSIRGTDLRIPFDRVAARRTELPSPSTRLAVYCRSGRMSALAIRTLARLGYRRIVELRGGMEAWQASGRRLLPPRSGV